MSADATRTPGAEEIERLRARIDEIDAQLVGLLNQRAECALGIGRLKEAAGEAIYQPAREGHVLAHVTGRNHGPLDHAAIRRLFERIIDEARRLERQAGHQLPGGRPPGAGTVEST